MAEQCEYGTAREPASWACWLLQGQVKPAGPVEDFEIGTAPLRVGRGSDVNLRINRPSVSTLHAELSVRSNSLWLRDLRSTNGTYVNGTRVESDVELVEGDLVHFADAPFRVHQRDVAGPDCRATAQVDAFDTALALVQFDGMMSERAVAAHFQPIVAIPSSQIVAYEALGRSTFAGLETPGAMFRAAAQLNQEGELSELLRELGIEQSRSIPGDPIVFLNTHPAEVGTAGLAKSLERLRQQNPSVAMVLEIHESAVANSNMLVGLRERLTELDIGLAYDDFGVGESRLAQLAQVNPDYVKFDIALVRDVHLAPPPQRQLLRTLVKMVHDCGAKTIAEGIEREEEHEALSDIGFQLGQGFFYGRAVEAAKLPGGSR